MVFIRKKKINGKEYHYLVKSQRNKKNIERYVGLNPPTKEDIRLFSEEYSTIKTYLQKKEKIISKINTVYKKKLSKGSKDEIKKIEDYIITSFTYNTSRIEGSTFTLKDTDFLLNHGIVPGDKTIRDVKEIENHRKAFLFSKEYKKDIDKNLILELHRILKNDVTEDAGKFRNAGVRVGDMVVLNHKLIDTEIKNLLSWYNKNKKNLHPIELVSQFHCTFERIHPFFDGNGRVGRLLINHTLSRLGYPPIIIQNINKRRYYNALIRGQNGNYLFFIKFLVFELENLYKKILVK